MSDPLSLQLPPALVDALVERVADRILARLDVEPADASPYLTIPEAAEYLRCSRQRIYDLCSSGRLPRCKDGTRVLVRRADLDRLVEP